MDQFTDGQRIFAWNCSFSEGTTKQLAIIFSFLFSLAVKGNKSLPGFSNVKTFTVYPCRTLIGTDNTVTAGKAMINDQKIVKECGCGWSKATTCLGLHIYQAMAKCSSSNQIQVCTAAAAGQQVRLPCSLAGSCTLVCSPPAFNFLPQCLPYSSLHPQPRRKLL